MVWGLRLRQVIIETHNVTNVDSNQHNLAFQREDVQNNVETRALFNWEYASARYFWWQCVSGWCGTLANALLVLTSIMAFLAAKCPRQSLIVGVGCLSVVSVALLNYSRFATMQMQQAYWEMEQIANLVGLCMCPAPEK